MPVTFSSRDEYQAVLAGKIPVEIEGIAEYEERKGVQRTLRYLGKLNHETGWLNSRRNELK
jgi:hypothetical protein